MIGDEEVMPNPLTGILYSYSFIFIDPEPVGRVNGYMNHSEIKVASSLLKGWVDRDGCYL